MSKPLGRASDPLKKQQAEKNKKKNILIGILISVLVIIGLAASHIQSLRKAQEAIEREKTTSAKKSNIENPTGAFESASKKDIKPDSSPVVIAANDAQTKAKKEATIKGESHINNTRVLSSEKAQEIDYNSASKVEDEPKVTEEPKSEPVAEEPPPAAEQAPVKTRSQIVRENMIRLFSDEVKYFYPEDVNTTNYVDAFKTQYAAIEDTNVDQLTQVTISENPHYVALAESNPTTDTTDNTSEGENGETSEGQQEQQLVRMVQAGDRAVGTITEAVNSDFGIDVFIDLYDPPMTNMRVKGSYTLNQYQDGLQITVSQLYVRDHVEPVSGFAIDITGSGTPLFDQDVDKHYGSKFWLRSASAFASTFLDYLIGSTTTVVDGSIVIDSNNDLSTSEKIVGGVANIAKEFLPDLRAGADRPATAHIPVNYPVSILFTEPVYLPIGLFDSDPETNPDLSYEALVESHY